MSNNLLICEMSEKCSTIIRTYTFAFRFGIRFDFRFGFREDFRFGFRVDFRFGFDFDLFLVFRRGTAQIGFLEKRAVM